MEICVTPYKAKGAVQGFSAQGFVDGQAVSSVKVFCRPVSYFGGWLQAMAVADLKTAEPFRRRGYAAALLDGALALGERYGCSLALLYPFSAHYYRRLGFETVSQTLRATLSPGALPSFSYPAPTRLEDSRHLGAFCDLYDGFCQGRNLSFRRFGKEHLGLRSDASVKGTYLFWEGERAAASVTLCFSPRELTVQELAYRREEHLGWILGFLSHLGAAYPRLSFDNIAHIPPLIRLLQGCEGVENTPTDALMGRVLDAPALLRRYPWPQEPGSLSLQVDSPYPRVGGRYRVSWAGGQARVEPLAQGAAADYTLDSGTLAAWLCGYAPPPGFAQAPCGLFEFF